MFKRLSVMIILSIVFFVLVAGSTAGGAVKPAKPRAERASLPVRLAPVYAFPEVENGTFMPPSKPSAKMTLGADFRPNPDTLGSTTYDYQHNGTMGRQGEHRAIYSGNQYGFYLHFDWMAQTGDTLGVGRGVGYQAFEIGACDFVFQPGGIRIEGGFAGYTTMDADPGGWGVPSAHQMEGDEYTSEAYWDFVTGGPAYGMFTSDYSYDNNGHWLPGGVGQNMWPKISWDIDGTEHVLHMVTAEFGGAAGDPQTASYYRRVGGYGTAVGTWSDQRLIDTIMNVNPTVVSSPVSDKVTIIWNAPVDYKRGQATEFDNQFENDIWYATATDNGAEWGDHSTNAGYPSIGHTVDPGISQPDVPGVGGNLTRYQPMNNYKAYTDISALYTTDDHLNMIWGCREWTDTTSLYRRRSAIFHWNEVTDSVRLVARAAWDTGGACDVPAWGSDVAKITISECDGKLYALFTQFGSAANPCGDVDADNQVLNGYLYMSVYDPSYDAWDRAQRVTNLPTTPTGCTPGDNGTCNSEYWASMPLYGRMDTCRYDDNVLDIVYVNDKAPGGCVQPESGVWTHNPIIWWQYKCREAVPEPQPDDDAGSGYGICYSDQVLWAAPGTDTTIYLHVANYGLLDHTITGITSTSNDPGNLTVTVDPTNAVVPARGGMVEFAINFAVAAQTPYPKTISGTISIQHQAAGSPRVIPFCISVILEFWPPTGDTLATACQRLRIYNQGQLSNNGRNVSMDFTADSSNCANVYLFDGSPIACYDDGTGPHCYRAIFDGSYAASDALRPLTAMFSDDTSNADYSFATSQFITADSAIGFIAEYYAPKEEKYCGFMIEKLRFYNRTAATLNDVAVGEALDYDLATYPNGSRNNSAWDGTRNLIYQYGCERDECDTLAASERTGGIAAAKNVGTLLNGFKNYQTLQNATYVYTTGPFGNDAPLPPDTIYPLMRNVSGYRLATVDPDTCEDLMTLVTFDVYDIGVTDTFCVVKIIPTSRADADGAVVKAAVDSANAFIALHDEIKCSLAPPPCLCKPGDANNDTQVNVGDAVSLINFVFKGGPAPRPYAICSGDANWDCLANVGDAVFIINFVFKGGPAPKPCADWVGKCGPY